MPPTLARQVWQKTKVTGFTAAIDEMLRADLSTPRKQRHTVARILARLVEEHGATELTYRTVRACVAGRRPEINAEAGRPVAEVFIAQTHQPGAGGEHQKGGPGQSGASPAPTSRDGGDRGPPEH